MSRISSTVETPAASRYLQQLCKHWSHRFTTTFDETRGTVALNDATLTLSAEPTRLHMMVDGPAAALPRLGEVVDEHLRRFAFREDLAIVWSEVAD